MAFVNEYIPESDLEKYGLKDIDAKAPAITIRRRDWTVDRKRNLYLRQVSEGHIDTGDTNISWWTFFWKGEIFWLRKEAIGGGGKRRGPVWAHIRISKIEIPPRLEQFREEIYRDLQEAFMTYRDGGVFDTSTEFTLQFDIEE